MSPEESIARPKIIAGNWKLNPPRERGLELFGEIARRVENTPVSTFYGKNGLPDVWILPPAPYLGTFFELSRGNGVPARIGIGAQDLSPSEYGAHTGESGGALLADFGCGIALAGHSERREAGENDGVVAEKALAADRAGMIPLLCVGESEDERDKGDTLSVVERQLAAVLGVLPSDRPLWIAYEPVWAIGTGRTATPEQVVEVHRSIRDSLIRGGRDGARTPILYGGSVKPQNAVSLLAEAEIDGALVGGASLDADSFLAIVEAAGTGISTAGG